MVEAEQKFRQSVNMHHRA